MTKVVQDHVTFILVTTHSKILNDDLTKKQTNQKPIFIEESLDKIED